MKLFIFICISIFVVSIGVSFRTVNTAHEPLDMLEVNRIVRHIEYNWPIAQYDYLPESPVDMEFIEAGDSLHTHVQNRNTMVPIFIGEEFVGTMVFFNDFSLQINAIHTHFSLIFYIQTALLVAAMGLFALYWYKTMILPFYKLERFAANVAAGDLDTPLEMDRNNRFGAFSESFDIMREQLALARENERRANISKKELVASLSHDIKTPAASIKVIAELYEAKHGDTPEMKSIVHKVDHIDRLISNLFSATLEELTQLKVHPTEVSTIELEQDIREADFKHRIMPFALPECVLTVDRLRFRQIIDNIIGNSYKYADTAIEITAGFEGKMFMLTIRDFGPGVSKEELSLLSEKFYRAGNAAGKSGTGLGLYLSEYFMTEMGGTLDFENSGGLCVVMGFPV